VLQVAGLIGAHMRDFKVVVDKSTVPVGTAHRVREAIASALRERAAVVPFAVVSNPEFLKEGAAIEDFMRPDRVVIGCDDERAEGLMRSLYAPFLRNRDRVLVMDVASAELTKYAANAMLATRISFMNELAGLAERVGADIEQVRRGIGSDERIGTHFLYAGCGFGGSCFPKDLHALEHTGRALGVDLPLLQAVRAINTRQQGLLARRVVERFGDDLSGHRFALWGLAFKPGTDDLREAPSLVIAGELLRRGASIAAYDPVARPDPAALWSADVPFEQVDDALSALDGASALIVVTEWREFRSPDFAELQRRLRQPVIFDGRNLYEPEVLAAHGFDGVGIGRPAAHGWRERAADLGLSTRAAGSLASLAA
jgi:UDPglucose 6-dehydrogenase